MAWLASCVLYPVQASRKKHQDVLTAFQKVSLYKAGRAPFQGLRPGDALASSEPFPAWLDLSLSMGAQKGSLRVPAGGSARCAYGACIHAAAVGKYPGFDC